MAQRKSKASHAPKQQAKNIGKTQPGAKPGDGFEPGPAPPEFTNRSHPTAPGEQAAVPGAGVVPAGADAGPVESRPVEPGLDAGRRAPYPGQPGPHAPKSAPGEDSLQ